MKSPSEEISLEIKSNKSKNLFFKARVRSLFTELEKKCNCKKCNMTVYQVVVRAWWCVYHLNSLLSSSKLKLTSAGTRQSVQVIVSEIANGFHS